MRPNLKGLLMCVSPSRFLSRVRLKLNNVKPKRSLITLIMLVVLTLLGAGTHESVKARTRTAVQDPQSVEEAKRLLEQISKLRSEEKYAEAIPLAERLIEILRRSQVLNILTSPPYRVVLPSFTGKRGTLFAPRISINAR